MVLSKTWSSGTSSSLQSNLNPAVRDLHIVCDGLIATPTRLWDTTFRSEVGITLVLHVLKGSSWFFVVGGFHRFLTFKRKSEIQCRIPDESHLHKKRCSESVG